RRAGSGTGPGSVPSCVSGRAGCQVPETESAVDQASSAFSSTCCSIGPWTQSSSEEAAEGRGGASQAWRDEARGRGEGVCGAGARHGVGLGLALGLGLRDEVGLLERCLGPVLEGIAGLQPGLDRGARGCVIGGRSVIGGRGGLGLLGHPSGPLPLLDELLGGQRARSAAPAPWGGRITGRADRVPLPRGSADLPLPCSSAVDVLGWILVHACALTGSAFMPAPPVRPRSAPGAAAPA